MPPEGNATRSTAPWSTSRSRTAQTGRVRRRTAAAISPASAPGRALRASRTSLSARDLSASGLTRQTPAPLAAARPQARRERRPRANRARASPRRTPREARAHERQPVPPRTARAPPAAMSPRPVQIQRRAQTPACVDEVRLKFPGSPMDARRDDAPHYVVNERITDRHRHTIEATALVVAPRLDEPRPDGR